MNRMLGVCLIALSLASEVTPSVVAQTASAGHENSFQTESHVADPTMRKGITVELPVTRNAVPVPKADNEDSLIVTITYEGKVYLGADPISGSEITEKVKDALSNRVDKTLYVKADARTPYVNLVRVLDSVRAAGVERLTLLTAQRDTEEPGTLVPPKGLELLVSPRPVARGSSGSKVK
jgi:biopolymer transport protein TolR